RRGTEPLANVEHAPTTHLVQPVLECELGRGADDPAVTSFLVGLDRLVLGHDQHVLHRASIVARPPAGASRSGLGGGTVGAVAVTAAPGPGPPCTGSGPGGTASQDARLAHFPTGHPAGFPQDRIPAARHDVEQERARRTPFFDIFKMPPTISPACRLTEAAAA